MCCTGLNIGRWDTVTVCLSDSLMEVSSDCKLLMAIISSQINAPSSRFLLSTSLGQASPFLGQPRDLQPQATYHANEGRRESIKPFLGNESSHTLFSVNREMGGWNEGLIVSLRAHVCRLSNSKTTHTHTHTCLLYTSPSPRDLGQSRMPSSA